MVVDQTTPVASPPNTIDPNSQFRPGASGATQQGGINPSQLDTLFGISPQYGQLPIQGGDMGGAPTLGDRSGPPEARAPTPYGLGGAGLGGQMTVEQMLGYMEYLPAAQLQIIQADLANAGYYGALTAANQPTWGTLTSKDFTAMRHFIEDGIQATQNGGTLSSLLAAKTKEFAVNSSTGTKPILDPGVARDIQHLNPNSVGDMIDKAALTGMGHGVSAAEKAQIFGAIDAKHVQNQMDAFAGQDAQQAANKAAQAGSTIDPTTGQVVITDSGIVAAARKLMGTPYLWGGTTPAGFDCSGFTQWVYQQNGMSIGRNTGAQWANAAGSQVDLSQAQPGDLVFFGNPSGSTNAHVGIYLGNGMMIDAPHTGANVQVDSVANFASAAEPLWGVKHFAGAGPGGAPGGTATIGTGAGGNTGAAMSYFESKGLSPAQSAGIVGNLMEESGLDPSRNQMGGGPGRGIAQWSVGDRWQGVLQLAAREGKPPTDLGVQLDYLWQELNSTESAALASLRAAGDVGSATQAFMSGFERPGIPNLASRLSFAQQAMTGGGGGVTTVPNTMTSTTPVDPAADAQAALLKAHPNEFAAHAFSNVYGVFSSMIQGGGGLGV
jgi:cell wall-associated NlpC family hydrolase